MSSREQQLPSLQQQQLSPDQERQFADALAAAVGAPPPLASLLPASRGPPPPAPAPTLQQQRLARQIPPEVQERLRPALAGQQQEPPPPPPPPAATQPQHSTGGPTQQEPPWRAAADAAADAAAARPRGSALEPPAQPGPPDRRHSHSDPPGGHSALQQQALLAAARQQEFGRVLSMLGTQPATALSSMPPASSPLSPFSPPPRRQPHPQPDHGHQQLQSPFAPSTLQQQQLQLQRQQQELLQGSAHLGTTGGGFAASSSASSASSSSSSSASLGAFSAPLARPAVAAGQVGFGVGAGVGSIPGAWPRQNGDHVGAPPVRRRQSQRLRAQAAAAQRLPNDVPSMPSPYYTQDHGNTAAQVLQSHSAHGGGAGAGAGSSVSTSSSSHTTRKAAPLQYAPVPSSTGAPPQLAESRFGSNAVAGAIVALPGGGARAHKRDRRPSLDGDQEMGPGPATATDGQGSQLQGVNATLPHQQEQQPGQVTTAQPVQQAQPPLKRSRAAGAGAGAAASTFPAQATATAQASASVAAPAAASASSSSSSSSSSTQPQPQLGFGLSQGDSQAFPLLATQIQQPPTGFGLGTGGAQQVPAFAATGGGAGGAGGGAGTGGSYPTMSLASQPSAFAQPPFAATARPATATATAPASARLGGALSPTMGGALGDDDDDHSMLGLGDLDMPFNDDDDDLAAPPDVPGIRPVEPQRFGAVHDCPVCGEDKIGRNDGKHFLSTRGRCPHRDDDGKPDPHRVCASCVRKLLARSCRIFNAKQPLAEWVASLGSPGRPPLCPVCQASEPRRSDRRHYTMEEIKEVVNGDSTCPCPVCVHARRGEAAATFVSEAWEAIDDDGNPENCKTAVDYAVADTKRQLRKVEAAQARKQQDASGGDDKDVDMASADVTAKAVGTAPPVSRLASQGKRLPSQQRHSQQGGQPDANVDMGAAAATGGQQDDDEAMAGEDGEEGDGRGPRATTTTSTTTSTTTARSLERTHDGVMLPQRLPPAPSAVMTSYATVATSRRRDNVDALEAAAGLAQLAGKTEPELRAMASSFQGASVYGMKLMQQVVSHQALLQQAMRAPFGVMRRCPVPGCDSAEYIVFDEKRQFSRFLACNHEICRNCNSEVKREKVPLDYCDEGAAAISSSSTASKTATTAASSVTASVPTTASTTSTLGAGGGAGGGAGAGAGSASASSCSSTTISTVTTTSEPGAAATDSKVAVEGGMRDPTDIEAHRAHNRVCDVTLGSQLVRVSKDWGPWHKRAAWVRAAKAMHKYLEQLVARRKTLQCPRCGVSVAKSGACNHVVCDCGEHLCQGCHRRVANLLPHPMVKGANTFAPAPYATYVAVDEVAMVVNHFENGGWRRRTPLKRLCPRSFEQMACCFGTVLSGIPGSRGAAGVNTMVGATKDTGSGDMTELARQSQVSRLRALALLLNPRVVRPSALKCVVEFDTERCDSRLFGVGSAKGSAAAVDGLWPSYPMLTVHECMYLLWDWGFVDRCAPDQQPVSNNQHDAMSLWTLLTPARGTDRPQPRGHAFFYDAHRPDTQEFALPPDVQDDPAKVARVQAEYNRLLGRTGATDPLGAGYGLVNATNVTGATEPGAAVPLYSQAAADVLAMKIEALHALEMGRLVEEGRKALQASGPKAAVAARTPLQADLLKLDSTTQDNFLRAGAAAAAASLPAEVATPLRASVSQHLSNAMLKAVESVG